MNNLKIGIVPNLTREKTLDVTKETVAILKKLKIDFYFDSDFRKELSPEFCNVNFIGDLYSNVDLLIAIGGDGSYINVAKQAAIHKKPVLCINAGNLAFLAGLEGNELHLLEKLLTGDFSRDKRMMLEVSVKNPHGEKFLGYCLNDVAIARGSEIKLIDLDAFCDSRKINSYRADGVVLSTPTGSTAYSWSAGGPVIDPDLQCIMLTPICTHSPLNRSLVFNEKSVITVKSSKKNQKICISADGEKSIELSDDFEVKIKKSNYYAEFIRIKSDEFYDILNSKLSQRKI